MQYLTVQEKKNNISKITQSFKSSLMTKTTQSTQYIDMYLSIFHDQPCLQKQLVMDTEPV